ncbi:MAG: PIN domain nuclease [Bacteroidota bacterium]
MTLIDSSVWIDYFNGKNSKATDKLDRLLGVQPIATGDLIVAEVLQGFRNQKDFNQAKTLFSTLYFYTLGGWDISVKSAKNSRFLRKKGITVRKTIDVFIGTFCIENNIALLHSDKDFEPLQVHFGLKVL